MESDEQMVLLWFALTILSAQVINHCYKRADGLTGGSTLFNFLFTALCVLGCGGLLLLNGPSFSEGTLILGIGTGLALAAAAALYTKALACGPFVISTALFGTSSLLPIAYCAIYPGEALTLWQYGGYVLLIICGFVMVWKKESSGKKRAGFNYKWIVLILLTVLVNSMIPYGIRIQSQLAPDESVEMLFLYFGTACILNLVLAVRAGCFREKWRKQASDALPVALIMAFSICLNTWVQSRIGAENVPAIIQFSVINACGLWLSAVTGKIFYSERLTWLQYAALGLTVISGVMISL